MNAVEVRVGTPVQLHGVVLLDQKLIHLCSNLLLSSKDSIQDLLQDMVLIVIDVLDCLGNRFTLVFLFAAAGAFAF